MISLQRPLRLWDALRLWWYVRVRGYELHATGRNTAPMHNPDAEAKARIT